MAEKEKRLWPGDPGYQGGVFHTTIVVNGQAKDVRTVKDPNGNPVSVIITDKILGIF